MATIASIKSEHNTKIRTELAAGGISTSEVADILDAIADEFVLRGSPTVANTIALASLANTETKLVHVTDVGIFTDYGTGPADGVTVFAGVGGRFWKLILPTKAQIGLGNVDNTSDANKPISTATATALANKVDVVAGKQLSTEDFTTSEKNDLATIKALVGAGVTDGDTFVDTLTEILTVFSTYSEGVNIMTLIGSKANANDAALTGIPTAPTAALGTDTTQIATTAFANATAADAVANANNNLDDSLFEGKTDPDGSPDPIGSETNPVTAKVFSTTYKGLVPAASGGSETTQFLRKDGTWAVPAGGSGGPALTINCAGDNNIEIDLSAYTTGDKRIRLEIDGLKTQTGAEVRLQVKRAGEGAYDTTAASTGYSWTYIDAGGAAVGSDTDFHRLVYYMNILNGTITLSDPRSTTEKVCIKSQIFGQDGGGTVVKFMHCYGMVKTVGAIDFVRIYDEYGNTFSAGEIRVYVE
jgi:hypothetical protein